MFLHMLSDKDKDSFLKLATLVSISDNDLHWDGKTLEELTGNIALDSAAFRILDTEKAILGDFMRECGKQADEPEKFPSEFFVGVFAKYRELSRGDVENQLLKKLVVLPLSRMNAPDERISAASEVMKDLLYSAGIDSGLPSISKAMLYELMLLALADGEISGVEAALLKQFATLQKLDDYTYDDLLERAKSVNREVSKTLSLILE